MQSMQSVILYGAYDWNDTILPREVFEERLTDVRRIMSERGWQALIVHGDARENGLLCYLTNFVPYLRWGLALVSHAAPVRLIAAVGPRDLPSVKRLTPIEDVRASADVGTPIKEWLGELPNTAPRGIAIANWGQMRADVGGKAQETCEPFGGAVDAQDAFSSVVRARRPRELELITESHVILNQALAEIERARLDGRGIKKALVAGERLARLAGAQDVRFLFDMGCTGRLRPIESAAISSESASWSVYLATRYGGYWAQGATTFANRFPEAASTARAAISAVLAGASEGTMVAEIAQAIRNRMAGYQPHPVLGNRVCRMLGLSLDKEPWLNNDSHMRLSGEGAYVVAAGACDPAGSCVLETATLVMRRAHAEVIWPADRMQTPPG